MLLAQHLTFVTEKVNGWEITFKAFELVLSSNDCQHNALPNPDSAGPGSLGRTAIHASHHRHQVSWIITSSVLA